MLSFPTLDPELLSTVERAQAGDVAAFETLVARYHCAVLRLLFRRLRHYQDAEDAAQQVFLEMLRNLPRLRNPAAFNAWLCSLVRCQSATRLRRKRRETAEMSDVLPDPTDPSPHERAELQTELLNSIERLTEPLRSTTRLYYLEGLSTQQISALIGSPPGTIKRRLHSARARLGATLSHKFEAWREPRRRVCDCSHVDA